MRSTPLVDGLPVDVLRRAGGSSLGLCEQWQRGECFVVLGMCIGLPMLQMAAQSQYGIFEHALHECC
jgi:hypothetical protein